MYLRTTKGTNRTYLSIVEGYRDKGKSKQKTLFSFGAIDKINKEQIYNLAHKMLEFCNVPDVFNMKASREISRRNWGAYRVVDKLWNDFKLDNIFNKLLSGRKLKINVKEVMSLLLSERLCEPSSKLGSFKKQGYYYGLKEEIKLESIYRTLDILNDYKEELEEHIFLRNKKLFNMSVNVALYDVTTFYFESQKVDSLRDFGYGKDGKFNEVQVVFGLLTNTEGRPVGFEVFSGKTGEGRTFTDAIHKIKARFNIEKITIVADRGLNAGENLLFLKDSSYEYIVASKLRTLSKDIQEKVLDLSDYKPLNGNEDFKYKIVEYSKPIRRAGKIVANIPSRIICTWSAKRKQKDIKDRLRLIKKAENILLKKQLNDTRGANRYISKNKTSEAELNLSRIEQDSRWDGIYGIEVSDFNTSVEEVLNNYKSLWKIEKSFNIFKSHLETRPMFHWSPSRIRGHLVLSYIAFLFERTLELKLEKLGIKDVSEHKIRASLKEMEFSEVDFDGRRIFMRANIGELSKNILKALKIKEPKPMSLPEMF